MPTATNTPAASLIQLLSIRIVSKKV
jgi:hypothetical protein